MTVVDEQHFHRAHAERVIGGDAIFSECGQYRYSLFRTWAMGLPAITWVMLNPSRADQRDNDPTIERVCRRSRTMGFGAVNIVNLFAFRSPYPWVLKELDDPVGPANDTAIMVAARTAAKVVVAWGTDGALKERGAAVLLKLEAANIDLYCLGTTKDGFPRHPLYIPYSQDLEKFKWTRNIFSRS